MGTASQTGAVMTLILCTQTRRSDTPGLCLEQFDLAFFFVSFVAEPESVTSDRELNPLLALSRAWWISGPAAEGQGSLSRSLHFSKRK